MFLILPISKNWLIFYAIILTAGYAYNTYEESKLNKFQTITECATFLIKDKTNAYRWTESFTCEQFTETLIKNAKDSGYLLRTYTLTGNELTIYKSDSASYIGGSWGEGTGHAVCSFDIGEKKYVIEPQTDSIFEIVNGRFVGLYRGE